MHNMEIKITLKLLGAWFLLVSCSCFLFIKECLEIPDTNQSQFKAYKYNPLIILVSSMCDKSLKAK